MNSISSEFWPHVYTGGEDVCPSRMDGCLGELR
jgi:hypothetical protein